jgi:hypothetical protein
VFYECLGNYSGSLNYTECAGRAIRQNIKGRNRTRLLCKQDKLSICKVVFFASLFLCMINIIFMVAGIFLNSVVIISLWISSQFRKKLCYFMILVLSCFDLAVTVLFTLNVERFLALMCPFFHQASVTKKGFYVFRHFRRL